VHHITTELFVRLPCYHLYASPTRFTGASALSGTVAIADELASSRLAIEKSLLALNLAATDASDSAGSKIIDRDKSQTVRCVVICANQCTMHSRGSTKVMHSITYLCTWIRLLPVDNNSCAMHYRLAFICVDSGSVASY
jgi:hypothetical protein